MSNTTRHPQCHMRTSLGNCDPIGGFCTSVNESICEGLHKVSKPQEWIPCSEGLPNKYKSVLTTSKNGRVRENFINACGWSYDTYAVVAWMPLPKPYKEGKCSSK